MGRWVGGLSLDSLHPTVFFNLYQCLSRPLRVSSGTTRGWQRLLQPLLWLGQSPQVNTIETAAAGPMGVSRSCCAGLVFTASGHPWDLELAGLWEGLKAGSLLATWAATVPGALTGQEVMSGAGCFEFVEPET